MRIPFLSSLNVKNKKVLLRVDFNVPIDKDGKITDHTRIKATLPTIGYLIKEGCKIIIISHLGRPKGRIVKELSLKPVVKELENLLGASVDFCDQTVGHKVDVAIEALEPGALLLLENVRFNSGEESNEKNFVEQLASLGDCFVNDAFGTSHRKHASTCGLINYFKDSCALGFLVEKEIALLDRLRVNPKRPFIAVIGGAKVSTKLSLLKSLVDLVDVLLIGGAMANTFAKAQGKDIGDSLYEERSLQEALDVMHLYKEKKVLLKLPIDTVEVDRKILDIGPKTIEQYTEILKKAGSCFWNGPLGVFENPKYAQGTLSIAQAMVHVSGLTVIGGGDSLSALKMSGIHSDKIFPCTGGGASLEYLEKGYLPAFELPSSMSRI